MSFDPNEPASRWWAIVRSFFTPRWRRIAWITGIVFALAMGPVTAGLLIIIIGGSALEGGNLPVLGIVYLVATMELIVPAFFASLAASIIEWRLRLRSQPRGFLWWALTIGFALLPVAVVLGLIELDIASHPGLYAY